jgi:hypothetical protein
LPAHLFPGGHPMIACFLCTWLPRLPKGSTQHAATQAQCCGRCGATLHEHSADHPHATALCLGFQHEAWRSEQQNAPYVLVDKDTP